MVLLSGEAGIGKSRLVQVLKEQVAAEGATRIEFRCSPYHQNSALYPVIEHLQRVLQFQRDDTPAYKAPETPKHPRAVSLPASRHGCRCLPPCCPSRTRRATPPLNLSPQKQKQKTQEALVAWLVEEAERQAVYCVWEDLHWADPSTLELLHLLIDQVPTARLLRAADLSSRVHAPLGGSLAPQPAHAQPLRPHAGRGDGGEGDGREGPAGRGAATDCGQDRWGAACLWKS